MEHLLTELTDKDQTEFIKGCQTQDDIRRTMYLIDKINKKHMQP